MIQRPPRSTDTDTLLPYTTLFRSEACGDVEVREFRRLAEEVAVVGGEALRPVEEGVDAGALQDRHPLHHGLQHRGEVVDVLRELVEAEVLRDAVEAPGLGHRLEGRSEERRVGKECVSTCRSRWSPYH